MFGLRLGKKLLYIFDRDTLTVEVICVETFDKYLDCNNLDSEGFEEGALGP